MYVDIYIAAVSSSHQVCAKGYHVAIVSTICETSVPEEEVRPALALLGPISEKKVSFIMLFISISLGLFLLRTCKNQFQMAKLIIVLLAKPLMQPAILKLFVPMSKVCIKGSLENHLIFPRSPFYLLSNKKANSVNFCSL